MLPSAEIERVDRSNKLDGVTPRYVGGDITTTWRVPDPPPPHPEEKEQGSKYSNWVNSRPEGKQSGIFSPLCFAKWIPGMWSGVVGETIQTAGGAAIKQESRSKTENPESSFIPFQNNVRWLC